MSTETDFLLYSSASDLNCSLHHTSGAELPTLRKAFALEESGRQRITYLTLLRRAIKRLEKDPRSRREINEAARP